LLGRHLGLLTHLGLTLLRGPIGLLRIGLALGRELGGVLALRLQLLGEALGIAPALGNLLG
jgi:hypothetical protein